jgi:hypothetical protein
MAWFADMSPYGYFGAEFTDHLLAVGWLEHGHPFSNGAADPEIYARLVDLLKEPWEPGAFGGFHHCDLCLYEGPKGKRNLFVPAGGVVFVCPELITHYMNAHAYRPPEEFRRAVMACPPMRSIHYLKALLAGVRSLVQAVNTP